MDRIPDKSTWKTSLVEGILNCWKRLPCPAIEKLVLLMQKCIKERSCIQAKRIHMFIHGYGLEGNDILASHLIEMLVMCYCLSDAQRVAARLLRPKRFAWCSLIRGCVQSDHPIHALALYDKLFHDFVCLAKYSYPPILNACAKMKNIEKCREVQTEITVRGFQSDVFIGNSLIDAYSKCGLLEEARQIFRKLRSRNVVSWNSLITASADCGQGKQAWGYLEEMQLEEFSPDITTFICVLKACGSVRMTNGSYEVHNKIIERGWEKDAVVGTALVDVYCKCGLLLDAQKLPIHTTMSWTALIAGYSKAGHPEEALKCLTQLQHDGLSPDGITFMCSLNACATLGVPEDAQEMHAQIVKVGMDSSSLILTTLVDMYAKCGLTREAHEILGTLSSSRNAESWKTRIAQFAKFGHIQEALAHYEQMLMEGIRPHAATYASGLKACGNVGMVDKGRRIHSGIVENHEVLSMTDVQTNKTNGNRIERDLMVGDGIIISAIEANLSASLVDMYSKCGYMSDAQKVFDLTPKADLAVYNALITGYARQAEVEIVNEIFVRMEEKRLPLDSVTFLSVLIASSHGGLLVHECMRYFETINKRYTYALSVEHYNCMIDLLGHAGQLNMAIKLVVTNLPFQPTFVTWCSVLRACCCNRNDVQVAWQALEHVLEFESNKCLGSALLCMSKYIHSRDQ